MARRQGEGFPFPVERLPPQFRRQLISAARHTARRAVLEAVPDQKEAKCLRFSRATTLGEDSPPVAADDRPDPRRTQQHPSAPGRPVVENKYTHSGQTCKLRAVLHWVSLSHPLGPRYLVSCNVSHQAALRRRQALSCPTIAFCWCGHHIPTQHPSYVCDVMSPMLSNAHRESQIPPASPLARPSLSLIRLRFPRALLVAVADSFPLWPLYSKARSQCNGQTENLAKASHIRAKMPKNALPAKKTAPGARARVFWITYCKNFGYMQDLSRCPQDLCGLCEALREQRWL